MIKEIVSHSMAMLKLEACLAYLENRKKSWYLKKMMSKEFKDKRSEK